MNEHFDDDVVDDEADEFAAINSSIKVSTTRTTKGRLAELSPFKQMLIVDFTEVWLVEHTTFSANSRSSYKTYVVNCFTRSSDKLTSDDRSGWKKFNEYLAELRKFNS